MWISTLMLRLLDVLHLIFHLSFSFGWDVILALLDLDFFWNVTFHCKLPLFKVLMASHWIERVLTHVHDDIFILLWSVQLEVMCPIQLQLESLENGTCKFIIPGKSAWTAILYFLEDFWIIISLFVLLTSTAYSQPPCNHHPSWHYLTFSFVYVSHNYEYIRHGWLLTEIKLHKQGFVC